LARVDFAVDSWRQVRLGSGVLIWFVTPKLLARVGFDDG
jgi:hypothetical protein